MKKIISLILAITMVCTLGITAFASESTITLSELLGASFDTARSVTLTYGDYAATYTDDAESVSGKQRVFELTKAINLEPCESGVELSSGGIYISVEKYDGSSSIVYMTLDGKAARCSEVGNMPANAEYELKISYSDDIEVFIESGLLAYVYNPTVTSSDWAAEYVSAALDGGWLDVFNDEYSLDLRENIMRGEFCAVAYACLSANGVTIAEAAKNPFTDTDIPEVLALSNVGIINGKGDGKFAPDDEITREEAATILYRAASFVGAAYTETDTGFVYSDESEISDWALDAVYAMRGFGIMNGMSDTEFSPKSNYTIEQSIATLVRLIDCINK